MNENGLWIKEEIGNFSNIIHIKFNNNKIENVTITQRNILTDATNVITAKKRTFQIRLVSSLKMLKFLII